MRADQPGGGPKRNRRDQIENPEDLPEDKALPVMEVQEFRRYPGRGDSNGDVTPACGQSEKTRQEPDGIERKKRQAGNPPGLHDGQAAWIQRQSEFSKSLRCRKPK